MTARHKPLYCCFLLVPRPPFLFTKPFCRQDGGIASPLCFAPHSYRPLSKVRCCRRKNSGDYRRDCHTNLSPAPNPPKTALSRSLFVGERACSSRCIEPLYSRNHCKRTIIPRHTPNPSKPRTIPRKSPTPLPPLSKGGGLTARHKLLLCCV